MQTSMTGLLGLLEVFVFEVLGWHFTVVLQA
jgi:hypothetical protein